MIVLENMWNLKIWALDHKLHLKQLLVVGFSLVAPTCVIPGWWCRLTSKCLYSVGLFSSVLCTFSGHERRSLLYLGRFDVFVLEDLFKQLLEQRHCSTREGKSEEVFKKVILYRSRQALSISIFCRLRRLIPASIWSLRLASIKPRAAQSKFESENGNRRLHLWGDQEH